ncbi:MAG: type II secretion system F family protein [Syntrophorhabdaceae bacterium]
MEWIVGVGIFLGIICIIEGVFLLFRHKWDPENVTVEQRLEKFYHKTVKKGSDSLVKRRTLSEIPRLNTLFAKIPVIHRLDALVVAANSKIPVGVYVLSAGVLALTGYFILSLYTRDQIFPILAGLILVTVPFLYLKVRKRQRAAKFQAQLPDALDLMARSLRAGHAFSGGLNMVAQEFDDPIGPEFLQVVSEINFGASVDQALKNMIDRVDVPDLKFFTVSVIVQKESGGNLADILGNIASLIRERFKVLGKIRALSAEGKLTAIILTGLPIFVFISLSIINPGYVEVLTKDNMGKLLTLIALAMMGVGIAVVKRMISIKV